MKAALCLSGHMRKFMETVGPLTRYIINPYQCDVFIHTWDVLGYSCVYKSDGSLDSSSTPVEQIKQLYKPKKIIVESTSFIEELKSQGNQYAPHLRDVPKPVGHMFSMFYKIYAANELKRMYTIETGTEYDCVIRCRPDLMFTGPVKIEDPQDNTIYIPQHISGHKWYTDQFAYGRTYEMNLYSSLVYDIPIYFKRGGEFYPERFMEWGLNQRELKIEMKDINFNIHR